MEGWTELPPDAFEDIPEWVGVNAADVLAATMNMARAHGCTCNPQVYVMIPFANVEEMSQLTAMQLIHESVCVGRMRQRGAEGRN